MIEERAVVLAVGPGLAEVQALRRGSCGSCSANGACGTSLLERFFGRRALRLTLVDPIGVRAGDEVVVGVPEEALLRAAFAAYLVPLLSLIGAAIAAREVALWLGVGSVEPWSLLGGVVGFVGALRWVARYSRRLGDDERYRAVLLRRVGPAPRSVRLA